MGEITECKIVNHIKKEICEMIFQELIQGDVDLNDWEEISFLDLECDIDKIGILENFFEVLRHNL